MAIVVNNNIASLMAQRNLRSNTSALTDSFEKLSSGYRINKASDDAAGLSISENLRSQIRGNSQASNNIQDGINMLQVAEGAFVTVTEDVQRVRELCVQAANETNGPNEREAILSEIKQRLEDINRTAKVTQFNGINLLTGNSGVTRLQVGSGVGVSTNAIDISKALTNLLTSATALNIDLDPVTTASGVAWTADHVRSYIAVLDVALKTVVDSRSILGAYQNRLQSTLSNLSIMNENLQASDSRIRDVDIAKETSNMTKNQILQQASASILSQANAIPQLALSLLKG